MSSETGSSSSSRLSQFGLYRGIDVKAEEFLHLSKKRQIRQGCLCATVSTIITVSIVTVILLIYEYAIAVESSLVQRHRSVYVNINGTNETDNPVSARLDRTFLGFDQDYYERMPLMVNAMQENTDIETSLDVIPIKIKAKYLIANVTRTTVTPKDYRVTTSIRRTSPRPFIFEFKSPTPTPFSRTFGSKSWIESYRNTERLKNLQQVIKYLEKTINAKFGDTIPSPSSTHIAFSGVYVEPVSQNAKQLPPKPTVPSLDLLLSSANKVEAVKTNHQADLFYNFKPESPGDVNLLADGFFRFSPAQTRNKLISRIPMFRPISPQRRFCTGAECNRNEEGNIVDFPKFREVKSTEPSSTEKTKSFSVFLNLFPLTPTVQDTHEPETLQTTLNKLYLTTTKPIIQFRRKSATPLRRITALRKRPSFITSRNMSKGLHFNKPHSMKIIQEKQANMILHVNVYPHKIKTTEQVSTEANVLTTQASIHGTLMPIVNTTQVQDYHLGSSGVISPEARLTPAPPPPISTSSQPTTIMVPYIYNEASSSATKFWATNPPDIIKFSEADAKVPDQYKNLVSSTESIVTTDCKEEPAINRRNFKESYDAKDFDVASSTLVVKLKNELETSTANTYPVNALSTTFKTYVPQINGHYRSLNQNSKNINTWLNGESEKDRKKRLEMSITGFRAPTYVPYVEIKRKNNRTKDTSSDIGKDIED